MVMPDCRLVGIEWVMLIRAFSQADSKYKVKAASTCSILLGPRRNDLW
jgi:hypothetical protein